jgi:copper chaperone NosL
VKRLTAVRAAVVLAFALALGACSESEEVSGAKPGPVHFESGDECHVCGMAITRFPGPKGEAIAGRQEQVRKFCSTRDMFSWVLQPENVNRDYVLYVHDMAQTDWEQPDDTSLIDAREAWFVVGSERSGAMGPTLASFADQSDAEAFAGEHGGEILAFSEVRMEHLTMSGMGHSM